MTSVSSSWSMKQACPCCGQRSLRLIACRACARVTVECTATGTLFRYPRPSAASFAHETRCAGCGTRGDGLFAPATSTQLFAAGLSRDEYESID